MQDATEIKKYIYMVRNYSALCLGRFRGLFCALLIAGFSLVPSVSHACCWACPSSDCDAANSFIDDQHQLIIERVEGEFDEDLEQFESKISALDVNCPLRGPIIGIGKRMQTGD